MLRARFEDAQFFYDADLRQPLEAFAPKLAGTQFHMDLGSLAQKSERVTALIGPLARATGLTGACCLKFSAVAPYRSSLSTCTGVAGEAKLRIHIISTCSQNGHHSALAALKCRDDRIIICQPSRTCAKANMQEFCAHAGAQEQAEAAARLARADLATSLVTEMTDLAGTLGRHYALRSGVDADVAEVRAFCWL